MYHNEVENSPIPCLNDKKYQQSLKIFVAKGVLVKTEVPPIANMQGKFDTSSKWIVDSGATDYITHRLDWFDNDLKNTCELLVTIPNNSSIPVEDRGSCILPNGIRIKNVLHVPTFTCNLLSFNNIVKRIRSNNGREFTSNRMLNFYTKHGILLETTCPHTPQQNGVVERKHRHLLETARVLKFEAKLPTHFWGECIMTEAYIINLLPSEIIENKTPYEIIYGQKPDYESLKVFGCLAYYHNTETRGDKFEERGRQGIFLGYPRGTKGYKIFYVKNGKIIVSRDVRFVETHFLMTQTLTKRKTNNRKFLSFHHGDVFMQNDTNSDNLSQNERSNQVVEPTATENIGQTNVTEPTTHTETEHAKPTREKRTRTHPARLNDYVVNLPSSINQATPESNQECSTNTKLSRDDEEVCVDAGKYRRLVGRLLYLRATRPDVTYSVNVLTQFVADPRHNHMEAAIRVLGYLKFTPGQGGAPISWKSKGKFVISRSSAEAEYGAMASTVNGVLWVRWLLKHLDVPQIDPTQLFCDNIVVKHIANNPVFHECTKHIEMDCYFVRERVESKDIEQLHLDSKEHIVGLFTKALGARQLRFLLDKLGICDLHAPT
ncbi:uncharacterized protein LOC143555679 [Bidens hawaiensis]|uniref:uncharacterized protein LOC143555679 n=1 Tax=Bidens hawaiensis TaxID=980011 RepID=UPI00404B6F0C